MSILRKNSKLNDINIFIITPHHNPNDQKHYYSRLSPPGCTRAAIAL